MGNPRKVLKKEAWREDVQPLRIWKNANFTKFQRPKKHQPQKWPEHSLQPSQGDETGIYHLANKRVLASSSACLYPRLETTEHCRTGNPATREHQWATHQAMSDHFTWQAVTRRNQVVKRYLYAFQYVYSSLFKLEVFNSVFAPYQRNSVILRIHQDSSSSLLIVWPPVVITCTMFH